MRTYKFLTRANTGPFSGAVWTPGDWVESPSIDGCRAGIHALRSDQLANWLGETLWEVELDGEVRDLGDKLVARRGRLVRPIDDYARAVAELSVIGAWRARDRALNWPDELAPLLQAATTLDELIALDASCDQPGFSRLMAGLAVDAAWFVSSPRLIVAPFIAACSAGHDAGGPDRDQHRFEAGFAAERMFQNDWLTQRLDLARDN